MDFGRFQIDLEGIWGISGGFREFQERFGAFPGGILGFQRDFWGISSRDFGVSERFLGRILAFLMDLGFSERF